MLRISKQEVLNTSYMVAKVIMLPRDLELRLCAPHGDAECSTANRPDHITLALH